jgi:hypothetical protein
MIHLAMTDDIFPIFGAFQGCIYMSIDIPLGFLFSFLIFVFKASYKKSVHVVDECPYLI